MFHSGLASTLWTAERHIDPAGWRAPAAEHAHAHRPSGLAAVALTKSGQVPFAAAVHVLASAARLAAPSQKPHEVRAWLAGGVYRPPGACPG